MNTGTLALSGISPAIGTTMGRASVTMTGGGFREGMTVLFNGTPATDVTVVSPTELRATAPLRPGDCGPAMVTVQQPGGAMAQRQDLFRFKLTTLSFLTVPDPPAIPVDTRGLIATDLNGNMVNDLVLTHLTGVSMLLGHGDLTYEGVSAPPLGESYSELVAGDINNDNHQDIVTFDRDASSIRILFGNGQGGLNTQGFSAITAAATAVVLANFIGPEPRLDIAFLQEPPPPELKVMENTGSGFGSESRLLNTGSPAALISADFNQDGKPDLATILRDTAKLKVFLASAAGAFQGSTDYDTATAPELMAAADVTADGRVDLVIAYGGSDTISVAVAQADGTFVIHTMTGAALTSPRILIVTDLNCDGLPDLLTHAMGSTQLGVAYNATAGGVPSFVSAQNVTVPIGTQRIVVAPLDRDTKPDIAILTATAAAGLALSQNRSM